jgi:hypothetical protein
MPLKEPHRLRTLWKQILEHPRYSELSEGTRFAFENAVVGGMSWRVKENNRWSRELWRHLYLGTPLSDGDD